MVSKVSEIIAITKEEDLVKEMKSFELGVEKRIEPIESLLAKDIRSAEEVTVQNHMTAIDAYRQIAVRIFALSACFLEHAKSPYFALLKGTEFERSARQKQLIAPFTGLAARSEGLIKSIDSRVNLCKVLMRVSGEGFANNQVS